MLDKRLLTAASFATPGGNSVDVGTDHAYLACELVESGRSIKSLATDVNEGPLAAAKRTVEKRGLQTQISLQLTNGLQNVDLSDKTDIFICGMGGLLIAEILEKRHPVLQNLILQPMTRAEELRLWLCQNGYDILAEKAAVEGNKAYTIINCRYDGKVRECDELFSLFGKLPEDHSPEAEEYLQTQIKKLKKKADGLARSQEGQTELASTLALLKQMEELKR